MHVADLEVVRRHYNRQAEGKRCVVVFVSGSKAEDMSSNIPRDCAPG